jgi:putative membrane protein
VRGWKGKAVRAYKTPMFLVKAVVEWLVTAAGLAVADWAAKGIEFRTVAALLFAAAVLAHINTRWRPGLLKLSLPLRILTLGLFHIVVNALLFVVTAWLVPGFGIASFYSALGGSLIVSLVSWALGIFLPARKAVTSP